MIKDYLSLSIACAFTTDIKEYKEFLLQRDPILTIIKLGILAKSDAQSNYYFSPQTNGIK
jgi:hypothetical protein